MKHLIFIFLSLCASVALAQSSIEKYLYHQAVVKNANTDEIVEDFGYGNKGIIIYYEKNGKEWISVSIGAEEVYSIKVVQTIDDYPLANIKVEMKKGAVMKDGSPVGAIAVFRIFDLAKNKNTPEMIRTQIMESSVAFEFEGIISIND